MLNTYSKLNDNDDRGTSMLFGDGCGIVIFDNAEGLDNRRNPSIPDLSFPTYSAQLVEVHGQIIPIMVSSKMEGAKLLMLLSHILIL